MSHWLRGFVVLCALQGGAAAADTWQTVMRDSGRSVDIDRGSILRSDGGTRVAWARVVIESPDALQLGYASVRALNRYDCARRSFYTIKRVYLDADNRIVREEPLEARRMNSIVGGSVDERLWREVCRPEDPPAGAATDLNAIAEQAGRAAAGIRLR